MSFPEYGNYRESGIPWVGALPAHWGVLPLVGVARERTESNVGMQENNLLSLSYGRIVRKDIDSNNGLLPESFETYQIVQRGDIVLRLTDLQNDKRSLRSAQVQERGIITSAYLALEPKGASSAFLAYLLRAYDLGKVFYSMGGGLRQSMKFADLKRMPIAVPSEPEQTAITAFLDRETEKIDALVAEQEKLVTLLAEKRQATICHAVTKGLKPNAPMKDSGVEWLGQVPGHWSIKPFFCVAPECYEPNDGMREDNLLSLSYGRIVRKNIESNEGLLPESFETYQIIRPNEIVFRLTDLQNDKRSLRTALVEEQGIITSAYTAVKPTGIHARYLNYLLRAYDVTKVFYSMGGGLRQSMKFADIKRLPTLIPPSTEQTNIVTFLDLETAKLDALRAESERAITLLKERRSALIAAAVTGQIDVCGLVPQPKAA
jgi:type I restriction enzyme S subunit